MRAMTPLTLALRSPFKLLDQRRNSAVARTSRSRRGALARREGSALGLATGIHSSLRWFLRGELHMLNDSDIESRIAPCLALLDGSKRRGGRPTRRVPDHQRQPSYTMGVLPRGVAELRYEREQHPAHAEQLGPEPLDSLLGAVALHSDKSPQPGEVRSRPARTVAHRRRPEICWLSIYSTASVRSPIVCEASTYTARGPPAVGRSRPNPATGDLPRLQALSYHRQSAAGWSSLVARRAHNPKVAGSNPAPAI